MPCTAILAPLGRSCSPQMGGLKNIYLISAASTPVLILHDMGVPVLDLYLNAGAIEETGAPVFGFYADGFTDAATILAALKEDDVVPGDTVNKIVKIDVTRQGAQMISESQGARENGTLFYRNAATIPTAGLLPETVALVQKLGAAGVIVIGEGYDGHFRAFGFGERATLESANLTTGAAYGDNPGATIVLSNESKNPIIPELGILDDESFAILRQEFGAGEILRYLATTA